MPYISFVKSFVAQKKRKEPNQTKPDQPIPFIHIFQRKINSFTGKHST